MQLISKYLLITEVDHDGKHIVKVKVSAITSNNSTQAIITRENVISLMKDGYPFYTEGIDMGQPCLTPVNKYLVGKEWFIKTEQNDDAFDNLGNLPSITEIPGEHPLNYNGLYLWLARFFW